MAPVHQHGQPQMIALAAITTRAQIRTRKGFEEEGLRELADSIKEHGILQPLVVTTANAEGVHTLVIGERRLLAASLAGLEAVPAIVREGTDAELAAAQAVENLQREDLALADVAEGLAALANVHGSWRAVAKALGKSPAWVSKRRALTRLNPITRAIMSEGITTDPEILLTLNQIEKKQPERADQLAKLLSEGAASRETIRGAWELVNGKTSNQDQDGDDEGEEDGDDANEPEAATRKDKANGLTLKLSPKTAVWLRHQIRELCSVADPERAELLEHLDAWHTANTNAPQAEPGKKPPKTPRTKDERKADKTLEAASMLGEELATRRPGVQLSQHMQP